MRAVLRNPITVTLVTIALALSSAACSFVSTCNTDPGTTTVTTGKVIGNTYISAPRDAKHRGPWTHFPPNHTLEFKHGLPTVPYQMAIWLAFQPCGTLAPAAGNQSILQVRDDQTIAIKNDTCSDFYVWLEASTPVHADADGPAGAAGASGEEPADVPDASDVPQGCPI
ncbi:MAG TPA: hypothetical protein VJV79_14695 [Polyangiaceae bacterium]|nr:hypothetical protein [Polyangiaceae bacterium]